MIDEINDETQNNDSTSAKTTVDEVADLKKQLEETKAKCEEYLNGWKRERADSINYKKDEMERIGSLIKYSNEELLINIIPVLDNIYLAEAHIPEELKQNKWIEGFGHIKNQLVDFLKKEGVEQIKTIGEVFDPNTMEAIEETDGGLNNTVSEEVQKGYTLNGKVIKVAKVKVIR